MIYIYLVDIINMGNMIYVWFLKNIPTLLFTIINTIIVGQGHFLSIQSFVFPRK